MKKPPRRFKKPIFSEAHRAFAAKELILHKVTPQDCPLCDGRGDIPECYICGAKAETKLD